MDAIATYDDDEESPRASVWRVARWLIAAAAALLLVTLFLSQTTGTEAAAPVPSADTAVYHEMAACPAGFNCAAYNCVGGNFCGYNYNYNVGWIGANYPLVYGGAYVPPVYLAGNYCPSGNFTACYNGGNTFCPSGNFSACYNGANTVCPSGNFSCYYNAYPWLGANYWNGVYPWYGVNGYGGFPYGYTGTYSGQTTIVVPSKNITVVGPPVYVKEVTPPTAATVTAAPPAAPAAAPVQVAPTAGMATAMNAPAAAPVGGSGVVTAYSAPSATAPGVQIDPSEQR
jgi:hypothetical protein